MPIWPVSLTDGLYQVADADGALYPLTMDGAPVSRFQEGWTPRGLQTGVPPFYLLEFEHESGEVALWLHDDTLDYRANAVRHLRSDDLASVLAAMDPVVVTLNEECVQAAHAAIPAAAHQFDGLLPATVQGLLEPSIGHALPRPEIVMLSGLRELGTGYAGGGVSLTPDWIESALTSTEAQAQESFDLPGHRCQRHLDRSTGLVFYVLQGADANDRHLFVPSLPAVFSQAHSEHDPLALLIVYYASNTNRVVALPEIEGLQPGLVEMAPPPQHGLDEPPPAAAPVTYEDEAQTSYGAPLSENPPHEAMAGEPEPIPTHEAIVEPEPVAATPTYQAPRHEELVHETTAYQEPAVAQPVLPAASPAPYRAPDRPAAPAQNWWQRLLGLGNG